MRVVPTAFGVAGLLMLVVAGPPVEASHKAYYGLGTAATQNTGTSGATLCLENTACTYGPATTSFTNAAGSDALQVHNSGGDAYLFANSSGASTVTLGAFSAAGGVIPLRIPSGLSVGGTATVSAGELSFLKISATGTAPGAGVLKLEAVAGTNTGTCKIIAYAGTSTTPVTVVDNVGAGC